MAKIGSIERRDKDTQSRVSTYLRITTPAMRLGEYNETYDYPDYDLIYQSRDPRLHSMPNHRLGLGTTATELFHLERNRKKARMIFRR